MKFEKLELDGAFIIIPEKLNDERGYFTRSWDKEIFEKNKINSSISQCNISYNKKNQ